MLLFCLPHDHQRKNPNHAHRIFIANTGLPIFYIKTPAPTTPIANTGLRSRCLFADVASWCTFCSGLDLNQHGAGFFYVHSLYPIRPVISAALPVMQPLQTTHQLCCFDDWLCAVGKDLTKGYQRAQARWPFV